MNTTELENLFGEKDWSDITDITAGVLRRRWPDCTPDDIQDAVQTGLLDLVDYWVNLDSSQGGDAERRFRFGVQRCIWTAQEFLGRVTYEAGHFESVDGTDPDDETVTYEWVPSELLGPEDQALNNIEAEELQARYKEAGEWLEDYLSDDTATAVADRLGISQQAVSARWAKGLKKLMEGLR